MPLYNPPTAVSYTPTVSAASGTITTASATGRYLQMGKTIFFKIAVTVTNAGTGAGLRASLPFTAASGLGSWTASGRETSATGNSINSEILASGTTVSLFTYNNGNACVTGYIVTVEGWYETD